MCFYSAPPLLTTEHCSSWGNQFALRSSGSAVWFENFFSLLRYERSSLKNVTLQEIFKFESWTSVIPKIFGFCRHRCPGKTEGVYASPHRKESICQNFCPISGSLHLLRPIPPSQIVTLDTCTNIAYLLHTLLLDSGTGQHNDGIVYLKLLSIST